MAFTWQPRELSCRLKHWLTLGFATWTVLVLGKVSIKINSYELLKEWIHAFVAKLGNRCFCWFLAAMLFPPEWEQHGTSTQRSVHLGKTFPWISCIWKIAPTWQRSLHTVKPVLSGHYSIPRGCLLNTGFTACKDRCQVGVRLIQVLIDNVIWGVKCHLLTVETLRILPETMTVYVCINFFI